MWILNAEGGFFGTPWASSPTKVYLCFMVGVEIFAVDLTPSVILTDATFLKEEGFPLRHFVTPPKGGMNCLRMNWLTP